MYHTTGFTREQIQDICVEIQNDVRLSNSHLGRPRVLGLFRSVLATLMYLRRNYTYAELGEFMNVSPATIYRRVEEMTPILRAHFSCHVPTLEDLDPRERLVVDGTLLPCWSWRSAPELYSGKQHTTGKNIQVACTLDGVLKWVSEPYDGRTHDARALRESKFLDHATPGQHLGDKGYIGLRMTTPIKKTGRKPLTRAHKRVNRRISSQRVVVERVIANLKTWRIFTTDYRRQPDTFTQTIQTVIALEFYRMRLLK